MPKLKSATISALCGLIFSLTACAEPGYETWRTSFTCGQRAYFVESHCKNAKATFELNRCIQDQTLSNTEKIVHIPTTPLEANKPRLYATSWNCVETKGHNFIALSYASGEGHGEDDESAEVFDLNLSPIQDRALLIDVFRNQQKGTNGRILSIFPEGEKTK